MPIPIYSIKDLHFINNQNELYIKQFDIHRGACYVFEGKMGAGKTIFLEALYQRKKNKSGEILFEEKNINKYSRKVYNEQIAIVPQKMKIPWGIVRKYMMKTFKHFAHIKNIEKRIDDISRKMNFSYLLNRKMSTLSPGELRWIILSTMIAADCKVLLIDEIEMHLSKKELSNLLSILNKKVTYDGTTLIVTTQNKDLVSRIASVIITLDRGRITSVRSTHKKTKNNKKY